MIKLEDLDLPPKFSEWRPHQQEAVQTVVGSERYSQLIDAPTGSGKSLIGVAAAKVLNAKTVYIVHTKQLQDQIIHDFPEAVELKGRQNYPCAKWEEHFPLVTAAECPDRKKCKVRGKCQYEIQKQLAMHSPLVVLNHSYFLFEANYAGGFSGIPFLILDEIDTIEHALMDFIQFTISQRQLDRFNLEAPRDKSTIDSWFEWAKPTLSTVSSMVAQMEAAIESRKDKDVEPAELKRLSALKSFRSKLQQFIWLVDDSWLLYSEPERWTFKPVWVSDYAQHYLWAHAGKTLGMSATILDPWQMARDIGIPSYDYYSIESTFPADNMPIYYRPVANLSYENMEVELPKLAKEVERIIDSYPKDKILCHTTSYKVRDFLMDNVKNKRLITHSTADRHLKIEEFKESSDPLVMVSPSFDRGVDLPYDNCRVVICCKVPWPDLSDLRTKRRLESSDGNNWYNVQAARTMIQMTGRGMRAVDDQCDIFILDKQFDRLLSRTKRVLPRWWVGTIK